MILGFFFESSESEAGAGVAEDGEACSNSQRAQHTVRRTHSGDGTLPVVVAAAGSSRKGMLSQRTKASSRWTRMRGFVPTCASRIREAARARCASCVDPFFNKSRVFSAENKHAYSQRELGTVDSETETYLRVGQ